MKLNLKFNNQPSFDEAAIRAHVALLHECAQGVDGVLVVSTFYANAGDRPGPITHHHIGDVDGMTAAIMAHATTPGVNVYTGLHVMRRGLERGKRGTERDIVAMLGVVADLDSDTGKTGELPVDPDFVIETSPGNHQPAIIFDQPAAPAEAREIGAALRAATGADHGTVDPAHVWRIPGTLNWPNATKLARGRSPDPVLVTVSAPYGGTVQSVADLKAALAPWSQKAAQTASVTVGELPDAATVKASGTATAMLAAAGVGDRSAHAAKIVERLAFDGHTAEQAGALFLAASGDWFERYSSRSEAMADFSRLWAKFGKPHEEAREAGAKAAASLLTPTNENERGVLSFMGEDREYIPKPELIRDTIPRNGVGFFGGQSGALKTFFAVHAATCLMTGEPLAGRDIERTGGVVYLAAEGEGTIEGRMKARRMQMEKPSQAMPFFTLTKFGAIEDAAAYKSLERRLEQASERMQSRFGVPLVAVVIDTVAAAGMIPEDKENDPGAWQKVFDALQPISERLDIVVILIHHAGKNANAGLRGSSNARAAADFALMLACDRDEITGDTKNHFLHLAKSRDAAEGPIAGIQKRTVEIAKRDDGSPITTLVLDFDMSNKAPAVRLKTSKTDKPFREAFDACELHRVRVHGESNAPEVQAARLEDLKREFGLRYVTAQTDATKRADNVRNALRTAITRVRDAGEYATGTWGGAEWIWRLKP
ncbi:AAA family ATPase [Affinirhizobium pseudoryzae]|uniref:AAA family ATPase n=1 Tax=Allorhizobium pseudoryzae TaxID=379684 RepID=UPI0013EE1F59|nr:AAA family ATPase [Allorhizobium pseudoryzae]